MVVKIIIQPVYILLSICYNKMSWNKYHLVITMSRILDLLQEEEPNYHPLISILRISKDGEADLRLQLDCHRSIAKYVEAERKSIDIKSDNGDTLMALNINVG